MGIGRRAVCFSIFIMAAVLAFSQLVTLSFAESLGSESLFVAGFQPTAFSIMGILVLVGGGAFGALYYSCNKNN